MSTIDRLVQDLEPTRRLPAFALLLPALGAAALAATFILLFIGFGFRGDLGVLTENAFFVLSSLVWLASFLMAILLALHSAVPGAAPRHPAFWITLLLLAEATSFAFAPGHSFLKGISAGGFACSCTLVLLSLLPVAFLLFYARKRLATTSPRRTVRLIVAAGASAAGLALSLHCGSENSGHLLGYHLAPVIVLVLAAPLALARVLRW